MPGCWNMNVCFTSRRRDIRTLRSPDEEARVKVALLITMLLGALQPAVAQAPYTPQRLSDGQPEITHGVWNRRGVGGLDNGALEAQDHRPPNPLDPTPANPLSVSSRDDGLNNVDRGFLDQFSEKLAKTPQQGQRGQNRERRQMGRSEERRVGKGWRRRGRRGQYKK